MSPQIPPHGIKLAVNIISTDFGDLVAKVCECLLRRGYITKGQISKFTELSQDKVRKCLWVLIQHNCVQAFALEQEGGGRGGPAAITHYMAVFNNIIHRLRFPKFLSELPTELDKKAVGILEGLLHHGRLTLSQVLDKAMDSKSEEDDASRDDYNESFINLVRNRLVERCPLAEPFIPLPTDEEISKQSRPKARKFAKKELTLEERALAAAIPMDGERFSISNEHADSDEDGIGSNVSSAKVGEKRKQDSLELASDFDLLEAKGEPVWRVNFEEFINRLRKKACVEFVRTVYDNTAAVIVMSMLKRSKITDDTVSMSVETVFEEVVKNEESPALDLELVRCSLEQLQFCSEVDDVYSIKLMDIIDKARLEEVESLVLKRFGHEAFRIFRFLSTGRAMHTDQISERTLTGKKDTPRILYKLWQDGFLGMEKIATGGPKQADFMLWNVKMDKIWHKVLDELYHAALNLNLRSAHEMEKWREFKTMLASAGGKASSELENKANRGRQIYKTLNTSLMELDDAIMLFSNFLF